MPRYNKKITRTMDYPEFKASIERLPIARQALLTLLFFSGCRISEALALTSDDIHCSSDMIYIQFHRLKGSKQTDPQEIPLVPKVNCLLWMCSQEGRLWSFSRRTAVNIVKSVFPDLYPHYFRMNRMTKTLERFGVPTVKHTFGLHITSIDHYIGKVDIKKVGRALLEEL